MAMYFTTDTHFGHPLVSALRGFIADADIKAGFDHAVAEQGIAAAAQYVKRAANKRHLRMADIADTDAHDAAVIASINATLTPADELWIMGDVGYRTSMEHIRHCLHAIHARRLHLVVGNHDVNFHHRELDGAWHHAFATIQDSATVAIDGVAYHLSHFPYREDMDGYRDPTGDVSDNAYDPGYAPDALPRDGRRLLFGHTHQHTKAGRSADSLHVGLDSWDLRPVSETQVTQWFAA
ncbi:phosphoesterase [uncultured Bifidobacterium sp.]|uniref:phosphoesterase n=1 Tax=uncultured Bifidobacterium sp. TaxID=165187 RepID=UPI002596068A|nr:phosphoesterase [uncultured Bifidobacterium sp.]